MAITPLPTFNLVLSPRVAILIASIVSLSNELNFTEITATSFLDEVPLIVASTFFSLTNCTDNSSAPSTT